MALRGRPFRFLLVGTFGGVTGYMLLLPVVPFWATTGGGGSAAAGATTAVLMAVTVATQVAVPWTLRFVSHRVLLCAGYLFLGLPALAYLASDALPWLLLVSALRGVGLGLMTVVGNALVAELLPAEARGRGSSWYGAMVGLSTVFFLPTGVWAAQRFGFAVVFAVAAALPAGAAITGWAIGRLPARTYPVDESSVARVPADGATPPRAAARAPARGAVRAILVPAVPMLTAAVTSTVVVTFGSDVFSAGLASSALLVFGIAVTAGRVLAGVVRDRAGSSLLLLPGQVCLVLGAAAAALAAAGLVVVPLLLAASLSIGFGFGALQNDTLVSMFDRVGPSRYATASTVWNAAYDGGTGLGSIGVGMLALGGYPVAFGCVALIALCAVPAAVLTARATP